MNSFIFLMVFWYNSACKQLLVFDALTSLIFSRYFTHTSGYYNEAMIQILQQAKEVSNR